MGAEISGEKGKPRGQELRCDSELRRLIIHEERVDGFVSVVVVSHGNGSARTVGRAVMEIAWRGRQMTGRAGRLGFCGGWKLESQVS